MKPPQDARRLCLRWLVALAMIVCFLPGSVRPARASLEEDVKAAMVYKFLAYVQWPPTSFVDAQTPLRVGVLGADAIADRLTEIVKGRTVEGRAVSVRRLDIGDALDDLHVIYIGHSQSQRLPYVAPRAQHYSTLIIAEAPQALDQGAVINLINHEGKIRFEVSLAAAAQSRLEVSSRMLNVALRVKAAGK